MGAAARPDRVETWTLVVAAAVVGWQLFVPPAVGLANNGDFHKVLGAFSLASPVADEYQFAAATYTYDPSHYVQFGFYSSEQLLALMAIVLNTLASKTGTFDLRFIGLIHAALAMIALRLFLPVLRGWPVWKRVVISALVVVIFSDVMYVAEFNSFYMDMAAMVFLWLSAAFLCRMLRWGHRWDGIGLLVSLMGMSTSKVQHAPLGLVAAAMLVALGRSARWRAAVLLAIASIATLMSTPWYYSGTPVFSQVFYGILPRAQDPSRELRMLGLDESYRRYIGMHAYSSGAPVEDQEFVRGFLAKTSFPKLAWFFLRRPGRAYDLLVAGLADAGRQRPEMGNFDRSAGLPPGAESRAFDAWSALKATVFQGRGSLFLAYTYVLGVGLPTMLWRKRRTVPQGSFAAGAGLVAMMFVGLLVGLLADPLDATRHSWVFLGLSDLVLLCNVSCILH